MRLIVFNIIRNSQVVDVKKSMDGVINETERYAVYKCVCLVLCD